MKLNLTIVKLIPFTLVPIFLIVYLYQINNNYLFLIFGMFLYWLIFIVSLYFHSKLTLRKAIKVPIFHKNGRLSKELIRMIKDITIERRKRYNKFIAGVYMMGSDKPLLLIKSKQFYSQIDCNADYANFGMVIELNVNDNKEYLLNWVKVNMPIIKNFYDKENDVIVIELISNFKYIDFNSPLVSEILYSYLKVDDRFNFAEFRYLY